MAKRMSGARVGPSVVDALGLDRKRVKSVRLDFDVNEVVTAHVVYYVTDDELHALGMTWDEPVAIDYRYDKKTAEG